MTGIWFIAFTLQWILLLLLALLMAGVLRYLTSIQEGLKQASPDHSRFELGDRVSDFTLSDLNGHTFQSQSLLDQEKKILLLFLNATCGPCLSIVEQLAELASREGGLKALPWFFILVCQGQQSAIEEMVKQLPREDVTVLIDKDLAVSQQYAIKSNPFAIALDSQGELFSQSARPASNWLYYVLDVSAPVDSPTLPFIKTPVPILIRESEAQTLKA